MPTFTIDQRRDILNQAKAIARAAAGDDLEFPEDLEQYVLDLEPERYGQWEEHKHKRGQPKNKGQFGPGGGGSSSEEGAEAEKNPGPEPVSGDHPKAKAAD